MRLYTGPGFQPLNEFLRAVFKLTGTLRQRIAQSPDFTFATTVVHLCHAIRKLAVTTPPSDMCDLSKWEETERKPVHGHELVNESLKAALASKSEFTQEELTAFKIDAGVGRDHFVKSDGRYFRPTLSKLYRGVCGELPQSFWLPDKQGMVCAVDGGFMSTSKVRENAMTFFGEGRNVLWELHSGKEDDIGYHRGAEVAKLSQFAAEAEVRYLIFPHLRTLVCVLGFDALESGLSNSQSSHAHSQWFQCSECLDGHAVISGNKHMLQRLPALPARAMLRANCLSDMPFRYSFLHAPCCLSSGSNTTCATMPPKFAPRSTCLGLSVTKRDRLQAERGQSSPAQSMSRTLPTPGPAMVRHRRQCQMQAGQRLRWRPLKLGSVSTNIGRRRVATTSMLL